MFKELNNSYAEFSFDWSELKFKDIAELDGCMVKVKGMFIKRDETYGNQPVIVTEEGLYSISRRYVDTVKTILENQEMVKAVNEGAVAVRVKKGYSDKYKKDTYYITFCDV